MFHSYELWKLQAPEILKAFVAACTDGRCFPKPETNATQLLAERTILLGGGKRQYVAVAYDREAHRAQSTGVCC